MSTGLAEIDEGEPVVPNQLTYDFYLEGGLKCIEICHDEYYYSLVNRINPWNGASKLITVPVLANDSMMEEKAHDKMHQASRDDPALRSEYSELYGIDRTCVDWDCYTELKFPASLKQVVPKSISAAELQPIKLKVLRCHVCLITIYLIWASVLDYKTTEPAEALFHPKVLPAKSEEARTKAALLRKYAILPIFGSTRACWEALEQEYNEVKDFMYYWPKDCEDTPSLPEIRSMLAGEDPRAIQICDLFEGMIGKQLFFPIYTNSVLYYDIFAGFSPWNWYD